ncbi:MAG TPA: DNA polymerase I [Terriglobales bacterium]|nr:DNA polymerase I [Terriglobales bacterium]
MTSPTPAKPSVFLIDAMSFIFRAYHAMARQRPMSTKTGVPTAATYVFVNMLRKLRADFSPQYLAAVFDVAGPTFRDEKGGTVASISKFDIKTQTFKEEAYGGYKANRAEMPPDLAQQLPYIRRALEAYRIPILELSGFEADDVIGTLAGKAAAAGHPVFVVSSDKDMLQLVSDKIRVLNPPKDNLVCDAAKVEEILGVRPEQVIDVMALRGDAIDNIPGAPGIGDKGSVEIIRRFETLENALEHAAEVEKKTYRESLLNHRDQILYSKQQVTIDNNVPVELNLDAMIAREPDNEACRKLFTELEFTTLIAEVAAPTADWGETRYEKTDSAKEIENLLKKLKQGTSLGVALQAPQAETSEEEDEPELNGSEETGGLLFAAPSPAAAKVAAVSTIAISAQQGEALAIEFGSTAAARALSAGLEDPAVPKAIHDSKAAMRLLRSSGTTLAGVNDDLQIYSYLLNPTYSSHRLAEISLRRFNHKLSGEIAEAADVTARLAADLRREVGQAGLMKVYQELDLPLVPVLARMEEAGVKIDSKVLAEMSSRLERECGAKAKQIHELAGVEFNINSPKQLGDILFNRLNLPKPVKYGKGKMISTAVDVMEELALTHEVPKLVLEYRQLSKLKSTYVDALPVLLHHSTGRLHTTFNQTGTATGRLSSTNPNLQNIPIRTELGREIRAAFIAEEGNVLMAADYSQIELRVLAHFSEDELLVEAFRRGDDIHALTAAQVFGVPPMLIDAEHRRRAKAVNFGIVYGLSAFGLSQQLGIEQREAKRFIEAYFEKYKGVRRFIDSTLDQARRDQSVKTLFGRVRPIPDILSRNPNMRGFAERTAVNTPLQGTAADLIKIAMIRIDGELQKHKLKSRMTLQVHDELVFEVPEAEVEPVHAMVKEQMENVYALRVPLLVEVGVGKNWRDLEFDD